MPGLFPTAAVTGGGRGFGRAGVARRAPGVDRAAFVASREQPVLTADQVAEAMLEVAQDPGSAAEYRVDGAGLHPIS